MSDVIANSGNETPVVLPFTVIIDTREQAPFNFGGFTGDKHEDYRELIVPTSVETLTTGDYSLRGFQDRITIERKSKNDLYSTLGAGRERFTREFERMNEMDFAAVIVEACWYELITDPPFASRLSPKVVYRTVISWQQRYRNVHWWFCKDKRFAEKTAFEILRKFYIENRYR